MLRIVGLASFILLGTAATTPPMHIVRSAQIRWGSAPDTLPRGARFAVIAGDPSKPGPFAFRIKVPRGYIVMPHTHPTAESITVISGTFYHGMGRTFDRRAGTSVSQGDFVYLPPNMPHSVWTTGDTAIIQINGTGPFTISYIRPQDDPRNMRRR